MFPFGNNVYSMDMKISCKKNWVIDKIVRLESVQ